MEYSNNNLRCLSIQREVRSGGLVTSICIKFLDAVFDSREERAAACVTLSVRDHLSLSSTHNQHFIAIKKQMNSKISLIFK